MSFYLLPSIAESATFVMPKSFSFSAVDVAKHNKGDDLYIVVDQDVYDLTKFQEDHPGGKKSMLYIEK